MTASSMLETLKGQQFCLLTTFRRDGTGVPTPMWFAVKDGVIYMATKGGTGKVKRLRRDGRVTVGPCTGGGHPLGRAAEGRGRVVEDEEELARAEQALMDRYGLKRRLLRWALKFSKDKTDAMLAVELE
jgi:PPOX class probable F420-dependent enzyme